MAVVVKTKGWDRERGRKHNTITCICKVWRLCAEMERTGIKTLVTKQNRSSVSLRHVTNCLVEGKECGEGNENCSLPLHRMGMHMNTITYGQKERETLCVHSTYSMYIHCMYIQPSSWGRGLRMGKIRRLAHPWNGGGRGVVVHTSLQ